MTFNNVAKTSTRNSKKEIIKLERNLGGCKLG
jgi:hypothetical protein